MLASVCCKRRNGILLRILPTFLTQSAAVVEDSDEMFSSPVEVRQQIRNGYLKQQPTTSYAKGYKQANVVILHKEYAEDYRKFAEGNSGSLPLLFVSKPGQFSAPSLCEDSDIRTDIPMYLVFSNGKVVKKVETLTDYDTSELISFYIGCSFSFNQILVDSGVLSLEYIKRNPQVSMYRTNVDTFPSGPFCCKTVVSMRPVHRDKLALVTAVTAPLNDVHGAPVHYGNPKLIGIEDLSKCTYGADSPPLPDDHVPVFWCCGVTGAESLKAAGVDLAFTHHPGMMFVTDLPQEHPAPANCDVIEYHPNSFGVASNRALARLRRIAAVTQDDPGCRGVAHLVVAGDFEKAAFSLSHARSVAVTTGFPVNDNPSDETDGLPGVISLAAALQSLGKQVTVVCDAHNLALYRHVLATCVEHSLLSTAARVVEVNDAPSCDVVVATERAGRAADGRYYSMRGRDVTERLSAHVVDDWFATATACDDVITVGIGDGGNELGMGKVAVPVVGKIACAVPANLLLSCGVSNWGCYGLALALYALRSCSIHDRHVRKAVGHPIDVETVMRRHIASVAREREILAIVESFGIVDGISPHQKMSVDGMLFDCEHRDVITRMLACLE